MELVLLQPYGILAPGEKLDVPAPVADQLIRRGVAKPTEPVKLKKPSEAK